MEYTVKKTDVINPGINSPEWENAESGFLADCAWEGYHRAPKTSFKMLGGKEGISILMQTEEKHLRSEAKEITGDVYKDSCMEFFLKPDIHDKRYINFEVNPSGIMHIGIGTDRYDRKLILDDRKIFSIESEPQEGNWRLKYYIPYEFLYKFFKKISPVAKANFYKCGEDTDHPHYSAWSAVETDEPDFHVPDFFSKIRF